MGPLRIWRDEVELDAGPRQQRCLLAVLLAREGRPVPTSDLVDLLWGAGPPVSAVNVIHKYVGTLRRLLEPDRSLRAQGSYLLRHDNGYRFVAGPEMLDLVAFRRSVASAVAARGQDRLDEAMDHYLTALELGQGPAGHGLADSASAAATFAGIDREFSDAVVGAAEVAALVGREARVLGALRLAADMGRLNEPVHASLVTTLAAAGQRAEALTAFRVIRTRLAEELGLDPGRDLQEAQRRALSWAAC
jgi:DNA-binding SARP family transcriptional activator